MRSEKQLNTSIDQYRQKSQILMDKLNQYNSERLDNIDVEKQELKKNDDSKYWEYQIQRINEEIIENKTELTTVETVKDKKKIAERITYL